MDVIEKDDSEPDFAESLSPSSDSEFHSDGSNESESAEEGTSGEEDEEGLEDMQNGTFVESQIEGDFDRFIGNIHGTDDVASSAMLGKIWDTPGGDAAEEQFQADLRAASGIGRAGKGKRRNRSRRSGPVLSHQVRTLIGEGNTAYVDGDLQKAIRIMTEVIRIEPRAVSAWSVLVTCYRELDEPVKALQVGIMGAHLRHDPDEWHQLARQSRDSGHAQQALYCLGKAMRLDPNNFDAIWDRAQLAKEVGDLHAARNAYLAMLKRFPHDTIILTELRHILIELGDLRLCAKLYQEAFDHYTTIYPEGKPSEIVSENIDPSLNSNSVSTPETPQVSYEEFAFMEVLVLADLYNSMGWYDRSVKMIRAGCRWLQGRGKQKYWDTCPDDREYDIEGYVRDGSEDSLTIKQGFYPLDINARHRLAIARLKAGDIDEGRLHASIILDENITDFSPLFTEIADAFFERTMYAEARPVYEMLGSDTTTSSIHVLMQAAECRRNLGDTSDAAEVYEHIIATDPTNDTAKMKLAEIYEVTGHPRKALDLVYQVIDSRKKQPGSSKEGTPQQAGGEASTSSLFSERKRGRPRQSGPVKPRSSMSHKQLLELEHSKEQEASSWYERLQSLQDRMRRGEEEAENEWLINAEKLVEMFRETRNLFVSKSAKPFTGMIRSKKITSTEPDINDEQKMASRLELELEHEKEEKEAKKTPQVQKAEVFHFRGIHFDDWLSLVMEYAFLLTRRDQFEQAEDVLRHLMFSTVYHKQRYQDTLRIAIATCAMHARKFEVVLEIFRRLMLAYQFNNEPVRLFLASLASGLSQADQIINTSFQKFILREMRSHASALEGTAHWSTLNRRFSISASTGKQEAEEVGDDDDDGNDVPGEHPKDDSNADLARPTKNNPLLPTLYGQSLSVAKSYQASLFYLLHAYDYFPNDPLICMTMAVASLGRAMQRQSDNRNYLITQAMGFMSKYRVLRGPGENDPHADEIEYNFGRAFHHIGLMSHAVKHYERVLKIIERRQMTDANDFGVVKEAAYNLSLIYVTTGAVPLAKAITQRWLSI